MISLITLLLTQTTIPKSKISTGKTEQLMQLVREHSHLYYPRLPEHRGAQLIHNTWDSRPNSRSTCCGDIGRIRLVKFRPTILGSAHFRTGKMLLTEAGESNGIFCPRSNWKHGDTANKCNLFNSLSLNY